MHEKKIMKFENEKRLAELNPSRTLQRAGFSEGLSLCDIGAGTGVFSMPAADISSNTIYALEKSDLMLEILIRRKEEMNLENMTILKVESEKLPLEDTCCDMVAMVTVFHELESREGLLSEVKRILKDSGIVLIVDFHKAKTPMGPSVDHRISEEDTIEACQKMGLILKDRFSLGDNFYGVVLTK